MIHAFRPGFCRLYPLGRIYEDGSFSYFLQVYECPHPNKSKVKIRKWLGIENLPAYEAFVLKWHDVLEETRKEAAAISSQSDLAGYMTGTTSPGAQMIHSKLSNSDSDLKPVSDYMLNEGYDYLVMREDRDTPNFELIAEVGDYGVYRAMGTPSVVKKRNERGQIVSETLVDEKGNPCDGEYGYSSIITEKDSYGNIIREEWRKANGDPFFNLAGYCGIRQTFDDKGVILSRTYLGDDGREILQTDGFSKAIWRKDENIRKIVLLDLEGRTVNPDGINLYNSSIKYAPDGWSTWMRPKENMVNDCFYIGEVNLGEKKAGDIYTVKVEIECMDVSPTMDDIFLFCAQGAVDGSWTVGNVWNGSLIWLNEAPQDGKYCYMSSQVIDSSMELASQFKIGFRCDNWSSGAFRVREVTIEKGNEINGWTPGV